MQDGVSRTTRRTWRSPLMGGAIALAFMVSGCLNHGDETVSEGEGQGTESSQAANWQPISTADSQISVVGYEQRIKTRRAKIQTIAGRPIYSESIGHDRGRISYNRIQYEEEFPIGTPEKLLFDLYGESEELAKLGLTVQAEQIEPAKIKSGSLASTYVRGAQVHCVLYYLHSEISEIGEHKGLLESASGNFCSAIAEMDEQKLRSNANEQIAAIRFDRGNYERDQSFSDLFGQLGKLEQRDNLFDEEAPDPDTVRPRIVVTSRIETQEATVVLSGYTTSATAIGGATVNGSPIELLEDNHFKVEVPVKVGENEVEFEVTDENGLASTRVVQVRRYPDDVVYLPQQKIGNFHALIIGNNDYPDWLGKYVSSTGDADLANAISDAEQLAGVLKQEYNFQVSLLRDATFEQILERLAFYRDNLTADDNLLIFFAGHGIVVGEIGYWMPVNVERGKEETLISNRLLSKTLSQFDVGKVMLIADACYSASFVQQTRKVNTGDFNRYDNQHSIVRAAMSSGGLEVVSDGIGQSPFNEALVAGLRRNDGVISARQLFVVVKALTTRKAQQTPQYGAVPASGHQTGGDFVFVRRSPFITPPAKQASS